MTLWLTSVQGRASEPPPDVAVVALHFGKTFVHGLHFSFSGFYFGGEGCFLALFLGGLFCFVLMW